MKLRLPTMLVCSLTIGAALPACQGKGAPAKQATANSKDPNKALDSAGPAGIHQKDEPKAEAPGPADAKAPPAAPSGPKALGAHLADPGWFRKTIFGDEGKVLDTKRSEADDQGRFSSLIRFELTDKTVDACADHLEQLVKKDVPNVERKTQPDGRVQLAGSTDKYKLTFLCGDAKGKTIAYVSYQWT